MHESLEVRPRQRLTQDRRMKLNLTIQQTWHLEDAFQPVANSIVALLLEALLLGAFTITYSMGTWSMLRIGRTGKPSRRDFAIVAMNSVMYTLSLGVRLFSNFL